MKIEYKEGKTILEGYLAMPKGVSADCPLVLVFHAFAGRDEFASDCARKLAELGIAGFAVDIYGKGVLGKSKEESLELMQPFIEDRELLRKRIMAGFMAAKKVQGIDESRIGAIGYCFGGLAALDLARSGADIKGTISFHGNLSPSNIPNSKIQSKILILHGYDDPHVSHEAIHDICKEMTDAKVDWQMHFYGNTVHAFTNPKANDPGYGTVYNKLADERSFESMKNFFREIF
ncbi:MAG: dienelactone hydrolase family protein [Simkaniaceae bacterium]|nr:dienelactone hydrolase family protein [Simkaniaceae bacterium]